MSWRRTDGCSYYRVGARPVAEKSGEIRKISRPAQPELGLSAWFTLSALCVTLGDQYGKTFGRTLGIWSSSFPSCEPPDISVHSQAWPPRVKRC